MRPPRRSGHAPGPCPAGPDPLVTRAISRRPRRRRPPSTGCGGRCWAGCPRHSSSLLRARPAGRHRDDADSDLIDGQKLCELIRDREIGIPLGPSRTLPGDARRRSDRTSAHQVRRGSARCTSVRNGSARGCCVLVLDHLHTSGSARPGIRRTEKGLDTGGLPLLAFQAEGEPVHRADAHGTHLPLTSYRHGVQEVAACLEDTGFKIYATGLRAPELGHETTPQGFVIARSPLS